LLVLLLAATAACSRSAGGEKPSVATTVYPVEYAAREIAGSRAEVVNVTQPGAEPHDVELTTDQVIDVIDSDLVVYLGSDFQPAVEEALGDAQGVVVDALESAGPRLEGDGREGEDAHFWLDPSRLAEVAAAIADQLASLDPEGTDRYRDAAANLERRLIDLDADYRAALRSCDSNVIVTTHEAFGYLAERYGLDQVGISGIDPDTEPSPQRIAEISDLVRDNDVTTIFVERLLSVDPAETIARETGTSVATLDPLESEPEEGDYIGAMRENLTQLTEALGCR
jgi:zinc transport system substrate-binding protein